MQFLKTVTIYLLCLIGAFGRLSAQTTPTDTTLWKNEFGLNVTDLITSFLGTKPTDAAGYMFSYKSVKGNKATRLGATTNFAFTKSNNSNGEVKLNNQNFQLRFGKETRYNLASKFQYYWGFDGIFGYKLVESDANFNSGSFIQSEKTITVGTGPVLGFQFMLYERLLLGTEGSLYAAYNTNTVSFSGAAFGSPPKDITKKDFILQTNLPKFIYLIVRF
jgi:hypothetical protein